jgi:hypothetical protein
LREPLISRARPLLQDIAHLGIFPFGFSVHHREGKREKRGGGERGKRNQRSRRHRVALPESGTLKLEPDVWQRRPSTRGWRPKQRSSSRHHLHHAVATVNFTTADSTATSSPPPQREPLRVLLLTLLSTQGGRTTASRRAGRRAVRRAQPAVQPMSGLRAAFLQEPISLTPPCTPARAGWP